MVRSPALDLNPDVVCSPLDDGGVLLDLTTKQYFALNPSGLACWQYLEDGGSLEAIRTALVTSNDADEDFGLSAFGDRLVEHGLATLRTADSAAPDDRSPFQMPAAWSPPDVTPHGRPLAEVILSPFDPTVPIPE